jgi:ribosomal RNA assembly protein
LELASPIQDSFQAKEEDYAPWSYPPVCTHVFESINDKLCVYTSTSFGNGRGISIFTTPTAAKQFAALPAFKDPSALSSQNINTLTNTWRAASIPDKGIGMLATQPLNFKDRVTAYTPAFLAYLETELATLEREKCWRFAVDQLPEKTRDAFMSLAYVFGDERVRVQDIVKANTFQVEVGGENHLAVFPETSRLNHACNPKYVFFTTRSKLRREFTNVD